MMTIPAIALTGCGGDDGPSFDAELLEGTWVSTSYEDSDGDETGYEVIITFDNDASPIIGTSLNLKKWTNRFQNP